MSNKFWVGGDGLWSDVGGLHWASTSNGTPGLSPPAATDIAVFDGNSGTGTGLGGGAFVTLDGTPTGGVTLGTTGGNFTGTLDNATNNTSPNFTQLQFTGSGTRKLDLGTGTFTFKPAGATNIFDITTTTGLTFVGSSSTISIDLTSLPATGGASFVGAPAAGNISAFGTINVGGRLTTTYQGLRFNTNGLTIGTLNITAPNSLAFPGNQTTTITNAFNWTGTSTSPLLIGTNGSGGTAFTTLSIPASCSITWAVFQGMHFTGNAISPTNSLDGGNNNFNGGTLSVPGGGGTTVLNSILQG